MATEKQCKRALDLFADDLSRRSNVVGLGIVPKDEEAPGAGMAVGIYVSKKIPKDRLRADDLVPRVLEVPSKSGTVRCPTRVIEQGEVQLESVGREPA